MFNFRHHPKQMTDAEYTDEYRCLIRELGDRFTVSDYPGGEVLHAMRAIEHEMNDNGGCNWTESDYAEYVETLRDALMGEKGFSVEQAAKIQRSFDEIRMCARELEQKGESGRNATEAVDYLIQRVVDWHRRRPA